MDYIIYWKSSQRSGFLQKVVPLLSFSILSKAEMVQSTENQMHLHSCILEESQLLEPSFLFNKNVGSERNKRFYLESYITDSFPKLDISRIPKQSFDIDQIDKIPQYLYKFGIFCALIIQFFIFLEPTEWQT